MKENARISCSKKNAKESSLHGGEMKPEGTLKPQEWKKSNSNDKYLDKYNRLCFPLKFFNICMTD